MFTNLLRNYLVLLAVLVSTLSSFAGSNADSTNFQTEAGFKITEAAARAILTRNIFKEKNREDFYVDIYDGQHFLLNDNRFKLRLKVNALNYTLQANTKTNVLASQCAEGWKYNVLTKKIGELKIIEQTKLNFTKAVNSQLDLLVNGSEADVKQNIESFDQFIKALPVPLLENLMAVPQTPRWFFVASYFSTKKKWTSKINFDKKEIEVSIGEVRQFVGSTYIDSNFEIEFQFEDVEIPIANFQAVVCSYLQQNGLREDDFAVGGINPQQETLQRLKRFNSALGF